MVLPREDAIYVVPRSLQNLGGDSPHTIMSTVPTSLGIMSLIPMCPMS